MSKNKICLICVLIVFLLFIYYHRTTEKESFNAHISYNNEGSYSDQFLTKINAVTIDDTNMFNKTQIKVKNIIAMTVIDNNTVYLVDFRQRVYRVSFLLKTNDFASFSQASNNITTVVSSDPRIIKIVKGYYGNNEVYMLKSDGKICGYNADTKTITNTVHTDKLLNVRFVDIAIAASRPKLIMGVTTNGRLIAINLVDISKSKYVIEDETGGIVLSNIDMEDQYIKKYFTSVVGNQNEGATFPYAVSLTDEAAKNNYVEALQISYNDATSTINTSVTSLNIEGLANNVPMLENNFKLFITGNGTSDYISIYRYNGDTKHLRVFEIRDNMKSLLSQWNGVGITKGVGVSNTGLIYHCLNNSVNVLDGMIWTTRLMTGFNITTSSQYISLGAYADNVIFTITSTEVNVQVEEVVKQYYFKPKGYIYEGGVSINASCLPDYEPITTYLECEKAAHRLGRRFIIDVISKSGLNKCYGSSRDTQELGEAGDMILYNSGGQDDININTISLWYTPVCKHPDANNLIYNVKKCSSVDKLCKKEYAVDVPTIINTFLSSAHGSALNREKSAYVEYWFNKIKNKDPEQLFSTLRNALFFGELHIAIHLQYSIQIDIYIQRILTLMQELVDRWFGFSFDSLPTVEKIEVKLYGIEYDAIMKNKIKDLDYYRTQGVKIKEITNTMNFVKGWDRPWGDTYASFTVNEDGSFNKFKCLEELLQPGCTRDFHDFTLCIWGSYDRFWGSSGIYPGHTARPNYITLGEGVFTRAFPLSYPYTDPMNYTHNFYDIGFNIPIHEFGHTLGLDDLYDDTKYPLILSYVDFPELHSLHIDYWRGASSQNIITAYKNSVQGSVMYATNNAIYNTPTFITAFDRIMLAVAMKLLINQPIDKIYYDTNTYQMHI